MVVDVFDARSQITLLSQCWGRRERASQRATNLADNTDRCGQLFRSRMSEGAVQNGWGGALQCERRPQLTGSNAISGPLKTMTTAARLRLPSKIDGRFHGRGTYRTIPEKEIRCRSRRRDKNISFRLRLRWQSWSSKSNVVI